ncbi:MAG: glutathione S-transferase N-terminal domain-containing protein [Halofilum sp. (in: g-proteobacteria)]
MTVTHRSVMTLYSAPDCIFSHRARVVLAEKDIQSAINYVDPDDPPEDLRDLNPYSSLPTLVDRDLVLYDSRVIIEYLDERFPHPPMMPVDPVSRAHTRLALFRIETDWYRLLPDLEGSERGPRDKARKELRESVIAANDVFAVRPFFLSDEFTMVDASIAPILWRLPRWNIELPKEAAAVQAYGERLFGREGFRRSLSEAESAIR